MIDYDYVVLSKGCEHEGISDPTSFHLSWFTFACSVGAATV